MFLRLLATLRLPKPLRLLASVSLFTVCLSAHGNNEFYSATVPVADRSEAALEASSRVALARVLVRVSGDENVGDLDGVKDAIVDARNRMSLYTYTDGDGPLGLKAQFDGGLVKEILRRAGATFWGEDRPPVLLWLVVDEPYSRRFATVASDRDLLGQLSTAFQERGVKLRLPLLDLEDAAAISPNMVWQKVEPRIMAASERYGTQHVLVGRMVELTSGKRIIDWLFLDRGEQSSKQIQGRAFPPLLLPAVDMVVDKLAERYSITLEAVNVFDRMLVTVRGVETYNDYQGVISIFRGIDVLEGYQVAQVDGDQLVLQVTGVSSTDALVRLLPTQSRLGVDSDARGANLVLRWGRP